MRKNDAAFFPLLFCLLPNKTKATYTRAFREIVNQVNQVRNNLVDIIVNFGRGAINAI